MANTDYINSPFSFEIATLSDPGKLRALNEDELLCDRECGLLVLADGMGGHKAGELASGIVTATVGAEINVSRLRGRSFERTLALVRTVIEHASQRVFAESRRRARTSGNHPDQTMGATVVLLLLNAHRAIIAHVGDSRVYRLRNAKLTLLTHDHSLLQEQIDHGAMSADVAMDSHNRHLVTRGLGLADTVDVAMQEDLPQLGDIYLLCSDGLNDMVDDDEIELVLNTVGVNLPLAAQQLVMVANDAGGEDNVSVILARVRPGVTNVQQAGIVQRIYRRLVASLFGQ
jgi:PPM family protein phosphatase